VKKVDLLDTTLRYQNGDKEAGEQLFKALRGWVISVTQGQFKDDWDDAIQTVMYEVLKTVKQFKPNITSVNKWYWLCIKQGIYRYQEAKYRKKRLLLMDAVSLESPVYDDTDDTFAEVIPSDSDTETAALDNVQTNQLLNELRNNLTEQEWTMFSLRYAGLKPIEIETECGYKKSQVLNTFAQMRDKLKRRRVLCEPA
jgi:RNA polymerase sigma factor (sigma-70 family)